MSHFITERDRMVGCWLCLLREVRGMSQHQLALESGVGHSVIGLYETGSAALLTNTPKRAARAARMAAALGVTVEELTLRVRPSMTKEQRQFMKEMSWHFGHHLPTLIYVGHHGGPLASNYPQGKMSGHFDKQERQWMATVLRQALEDDEKVFA